MNRLRTHIVRIVVLVLVWMGFSLYMVQSAKAEYSSHAFARWFSSMLSTSKTADLQQQLNDLQKSNDHLDKILEEASRIVRRNNDDFSFPFAKSAKKQQLYQLLLFEWNQYQTENAMASIPAQQTVKSLVPVKVDKSGSCGTVTTSINVPQFLYCVEALRSISEHSSNTISPMSSGIAIGAP